MRPEESERPSSDGFGFGADVSSEADADIDIDVEPFDEHGIPDPDAEYAGDSDRFASAPVRHADTDVAHAPADSVAHALVGSHVVADSGPLAAPAHPPRHRGVGDRPHL